MNLYIVYDANYDWECFVFETTKNKAKKRVAEDFFMDYIDVRCKTLKKGVNFPYPKTINCMARRHILGEEQRQGEIERYISDIVYDRKIKFLNEADNWSKIAADCRKQYSDFIKPYDGKKIIDIPIGVIKKAEELLRYAQQADQKWDECMRKVDMYDIP